MRANCIAVGGRRHRPDNRPAFLCGGCAPFDRVTVRRAMARMRRQPYVAFFVRGHQIAPQKQKAPFRRTEGVASKTYNTPSYGFLKTAVTRHLLQKRASLRRRMAWYKACMRDVALLCSGLARASELAKRNQPGKSKVWPLKLRKLN